MTRRFPTALGVMGLLITAATFTPQASGGDCPLAECTLEFDNACPDIEELCGATFVGGTGCVVDFLPFCYSSGEFSYRIDPGLDLTILLSGDVLELEVFFANVEGSSGEMRFFNARDKEIGTPIPTNGDCGIGMPPFQDRTFAEGVRRIEVTATGGQVYIDTFHINEGVTPAADLNGDCSVGPADLAILLGSWGVNPGHPADLNGDGNVGPPDLAILLGSWGPA